MFDVKDPLTGVEIILQPYLNSEEHLHSPKSNPAYLINVIWSSA